MSSSKRRKLDAQVAPQAPVSAISALAARRRLAAPTPAQEPSSSPEPEETPARTNAFSVLQNLKRNSDSPKSPKRGSGISSNKAKLKSSLQKKPNTESGLSTPDTGSVTPQRASYSSFLLSKNNCRITPNGVLQLRLKDSERFLILGNYGIRVLTGEVAVSGAIFRPSEKIHWIHAPHCHSIPVLRTPERTSLEIHNDPNFDDFRKLDRLSPLFKKIWNDLDDGKESKLGTGRTFQVICTSDDAPKKSVIQELSSPPEWNKKLATLVSSVTDSGPSVILVCGPKSAGKSTFSKLLTNRLLTGEQTTSQKSTHGVAVLDLDPGQPEYAPPGTLSLVHITQPNLGVPFTHPSLDDTSYKVVRCHALASVTPASAPEYYLESALDLLETARRTLRNSHLLINSPGWILGTGLDLLVELINKVNPAEVIYMSEDGPAETVEGLRSATKKMFTTLPSQPSEFASRTAAHLRTMSTMSYFHLTNSGSSGMQTRLKWNPSPLSALPPWQVRYSGPQSGILGILSYDYQSPPELLVDSINGMIVAAVDIEDPKAFRGLLKGDPPEAAADAMDTSGETGELINLVSSTPEGLPYIPNPNDVALDPRYSKTIGLVLIRGINTATKCLEVLTPIPPKRIQEIKSQGRHMVLVHGKFDAPTWAYTEDLYERSGQQDESADKQLEGMNDDTSEDEDEDQEIDVDGAGATSPSGQSAGSNAGPPWVEILKGNEKRPIGSRVWRVRRDLGRSQGD
ncbi:Polynucleotide 5'-hydroxyl-kinase GRC3 [Cladobotryum mycophilum]|uniref:Polynucleotide 5'-hydroxyl-kinase GRC3 n=1 Tax=Cladobotryum mycophilum TaxID=491253 RepID=A0ABR0SUQ8_9HYPO